jgi:hypothetical protein
MATLVEEQDNVYYDDRKIKKIIELRRSSSKDKENQKPKGLSLLKVFLIFI